MLQNGRLRKQPWQEPPLGMLGYLILLQTDTVPRGLPPEQLQEGLLIPDDLSSSILSDWSNQDQLNPELSQHVESEQQMLQLAF